MANAQTSPTPDITINHKPHGGLYKVGAQLNFPDNIATLVELNYIVSDYDDGIEDTANYKITPGVAGWYNIIGQVLWASVVADKSYDALIYKNVSDAIALGVAHASCTDGLITRVTTRVYLNTTDYITLRARPHAGVGTVDISPGEAITFLLVSRER